MGIEVANRIKGTREYYFSSKLREIRESGKDVINLAIGSPDLPPSPRIVERLHHSSNDPSKHSYQSYQGIPELRSAFADWYLKHYKVPLDAGSNILPLMGSKEGIMHITMAYIQEGDKVFVPNPGYPAYRSITELSGGTPVDYKLTRRNNWYPDLEELASEDLSDFKLMWVNYPNMPTGAPADRSFFKELVQFGKENEILIVNDNPYSFILNDDPTSILEADPDLETTAELNSLSKSFNMAGWRVGVLAGHHDLIRNVLVFKSNMDSGMFYPIQAAASEALQLEEEWYKEINSIYRERRKLAEQVLDIMKCTYDKHQSGMFIWAKIPPEWSSGQEFSEWLLDKAEVFISPGFIFGSQGDEYVRISLSNPEDQFRLAMKRIEKEIKRRNN